MKTNFRFWPGSSLLTCIFLLSFLSINPAAQAQVITLSSTSRFFGSVAVGGTSASSNVRVRNTSTSAVSLTVAPATGDFAQTNTCGSSLAGGAACVITVTFTPTTTGKRTGSITVTDSVDANAQTISLQGTGVSPVTISPTSRNLGSVVVGTASSAVTFTVRNNLTTAVGLSIGAAAPVAIGAAGSCGSSLAGGASCTISATLTPGATGVQTGTVSVNYGALLGSPQSLNLQANGILPLTAFPSSLTFSNTLRVGTPSNPRTVTISNQESTALAIQGIVATPSDYATTTTCGTSLAAGSSCTVSVVFTPTAAGNRPGTLTISDNAAADSQTVVALSGGGILNNLVSISISAPNPTLAVGLQEQLVATGTYGNGTTGNITSSVTWTSNAVGIATIGATGVATGVGAGNVTITATVAGSKAVGTIGLSVFQAVLQSIAVTPASISLGLNAKQPFSALGTYSNGSTLNLTSQVTWSSGNPAVVSISPLGVATVLATSTTAIPITASLTNSAGALITSPPAWLSALSTLPIVCSSPTIDMKLLVVNNSEANTGAGYADYPAVQQILSYIGVPYDVVDVTAPAPTLSDGSCHGYYQGVIFPFGDDIYNITSWSSTLQSYEITFGVRQLNWYVNPTPDFGLNYSTGSVTSSQTDSATFTVAATPIFFYANTATPVTIANAFVYLTTPTTPTAGGTVTPLLTDASGNTLSAITQFTDGRQYLNQMFDSNPYLMHDLVLAYGLINWVTKGVFLGDYHVYAAAQVDDFFINDAEWVPGTPCTDPITHDRTAPDAAGLPNFRVTYTDMAALVAWQKAKQTDPLLSTFKLTLAFNGVGTAGNSDWTGVTGGVAADTLLTNLQSYQQNFHWISHTYDHPTTLNGLHKSDPGGDVADNPPVDDIDLEILTNRWVASNPGGVNLDVDPSDAALTQLTFTDFNPGNLVTPGVTGLNDPNVPTYLYEDGIRYVVTDTSVIGQPNNGPNPSPNVGIVNSYETGLYEVPRHPNDVFFNAANWLDDDAEFQCIYSYPTVMPPFNTFTAAQILDFVSSSFVTNMLMGDMDPEMFHQPNLHFSTNTASGMPTTGLSSSLLTDTYDQTFAKYEQAYKLPVLSPTLDQLGQNMKNRNSFNLSLVTGSIVNAGAAGAAVTLTMPSTATVQNAVVPVTGLKSNGSESYGGQNISHVNMRAGQTITFLLQ